MGMSRFDGIFKKAFKKAFTAHCLRSVAWSYPVTPLAAFALSRRIRQVRRDRSAEPWLARPTMPPSQSSPALDTPSGPAC
jgi:hypothetical protein